MPKIDERSPIERVQAMVNEANIRDVVEMNASMMGSFDVQKMQVYSDYIDSLQWPTGVVFACMMTTMADALTNMPREARASFLVSFVSMLGPMIDSVEAELRKGTH